MNCTASKKLAVTGAPPAAMLLPLGDDEFPDEALAVVCSHLGPRELGRLACAARRFTEPTLTLGFHVVRFGGSAVLGGAQLLSPIEEGARLRLAAGSGGGGVAAERWAGETWVRALWRVQYCWRKWCDETASRLRLRQ